MNRISKRAFFILTSFFVVGCQSQQIKQRDVQQLTLYFTANQHGFRSPCGCSIVPLGGTRRLTAFFSTQSQGAKLFFHAGTAFAPVKDSYFQGVRSQRTRLALVKDWNTLNLHAFTPSLEDLSIGAKSFNALKQAANFSFLSANILYRGKPFLPAARIISIEGTRVAVVGVSGGNLEQTSEFSLGDPVATVREAIQGLGNFDLLVILSSLNDLQTTRLRKSIQRAHIYFGGPEVSQDFQFSHGWNHSLYVNPQGMGRTVAQVQVQLRGEAVTFFNPDVSRSTQEQKVFLSLRLAAIQQALAQKKTVLNRKVYRSEMESIRGQLNRVREISALPPQNTTPYKITIETLTEKFDK